jgi:hypothetical protein
MKQLQLKAVMSDEQADEFLKNPAEVSHAPLVLDEEFIAVDDNGTVQLVYMKLPENDDFIKLKAVLQKLKYGKSTRVGGLTTESTIFGFQPPVEIRMRPYCSMTGLASEYPKVDKFMAYYCEKNIMPLLKEHYADNLAQHMEAIKDIKPDWLMSGVPFTGGVINNSNQLNYHTDIQNTKGSINAMIYFVRDTDGGELVLPKYGVSVKPLDRFVLLFRNDLVHGVAPITKLNNASYRFSIVYYANARMNSCGTMEQEMAKARSKSARLSSVGITPTGDNM